MEDLKKGKYNILIVPSGYVFNRPTIIEEVEKDPHGRCFLCECICGNTKEISLNKLHTGHTKSCGCLNKEIHTKHGMRSERLYRCWTGMYDRVNKRTECEVYPPWKDYTVFRGWAISSGYTDDLVLSRRLDLGDYTP